VAEVTIPYKPRDWQQAFHDDESRFRVVVWHRRAGKTVACVNDIVRQALTCERPNPQFAYIAPTYRQAYRVAWPYFRQFLNTLPGVDFRVSDMRIDLPNGAKIFCLGVDNADAIRGMYLDGCVIDETAQVPSTTWALVLRPALADRQGTAIFIGTPMGTLNLLYERFTDAPDLPGWSASLLTINDTHALPDDEIAALQREMLPDEFQQEMFCSWTAAVRGAFYAKEMNEVHQDGRILPLQRDSALTTVAGWDFGYADLTVVWFAQLNGTEVRLVDCKAYQATKLGDIMDDLPHADEHYLPHDATAHELISGASRKEIFDQRGLAYTVVPRPKAIADVIEAGRRLLPRCWFDQSSCKVAIEALTLYRAEYDDVKRVSGKTPIHDWTSHYADAFGVLAQGLPVSTKPFNWGGPLQYDDTGVI
jgi:hypothetical protein